MIFGGGRLVAYLRIFAEVGRAVARSCWAYIRWIECSQSYDWMWIPSRRIFSMVFRVASGALLLLMSMASGSATVTIYDDAGGQIGEYLDRFHALRRSGEQVIIDGTCASACA